MDTTMNPGRAELRDRLLRAKLPGPVSWEALAPVYRKELLEADRHNDEPTGTWRLAAVLVLLQPAPDGWQIPLIVRSADGGVHSGQVALPGGAVEKGESALTCALREFEEEVGCTTAEIEVIRELTPLPVPPSRFVITPVVALTGQKPSYTPNRYEVQELLFYLLDDLLALKDYSTMPVRHADRVYQVPCITTGGHRIWGATAMILAELRELLLSEYPLSEQQPRFRPQKPGEPAPDTLCQ